MEKKLDQIIETLQIHNTKFEQVFEMVESNAKAIDKLAQMMFEGFGKIETLDRKIDDFAGRKANVDIVQSQHNKLKRLEKKVFGQAA